MKMTHYLTNEISISKIKGVAACGLYVSRERFGDNVTNNRENVTCGNCKRSRIYRQVLDLVTCKHGVIVGCDMNGRKHKCKC